MSSDVGAVTAAPATPTPWRPDAREALASAGLVMLVALVGGIVASTAIVFPKPEDTAYYVGVARNVLEGRGLVSDAIWSYATPPLSFPRPAFEVWLPLPSLLAVGPMWLFGTTFSAAQWVSMLAGALVAGLAWRLAADVAVERTLPAGRARTLALGVGLTTAVYLPVVLSGALPDSTLVFAAIALAACLLMTRVLRDPGAGRLGDPRVWAIGLLLGLGALTRNEAVWLALAWAGLVVVQRSIGRAAKVRLVGLAALVSIAVYAPWAVRDWLAFGSAFPGQALDNALSVNGTDIFAWADPPTLQRYLDQGLATLLELRVTGTLHNLLNVLLFLGIPVSIAGLLGLPWAARLRSLRPLVVYAVVTFLVASLLFPVSTTWGTFLHAAGAIHVLLVVSALLALDGLIARVGVIRGWTRPVAWLGATFAIVGSILFSLVLLPIFAAGSRQTEVAYEAIGPVLAEAGLPLIPSSPVITDYPIWLAETWRQEALALPDEPPAAVLDLAAAFPGTRTLVLFGGLHERWPDALDDGEPGSECFTEVPLAVPDDPAAAEALDGVRAWRIGCP